MSFIAFGQKTIRLTWNPSTDNVGVAGYVVWVDNVRYDSTENIYYDFDFEAGRFGLSVSAYDAAGNESEQSEVLFVDVADITTPSTPNLLSIEYNEASVKITWIKSTDNVKVAGYNIYVNGVFHDYTIDNSYELHNLIPENHYNLSISSYDDSGNESEKTSEIDIILPFDELTMRVYPNPVSKGYFKILFENGIIKDNSIVRVITVDGKTIYERQIFAGNTPYEEEFHLEEVLTNGMYIIAFFENNTQKLFAYIMVAKPTFYNANYVNDYLDLMNSNEKSLEFK